MTLKQIFTKNILKTKYTASKVSGICLKQFLIPNLIKLFQCIQLADADVVFVLLDLFINVRRHVHAPLTQNRRHLRLAVTGVLPEFSEILTDSNWLLL